MSDLYSNRGRIHNEQKIKQPQLYTTSAAYRSDPVPSRLRFILVTSNQSLLYTIAFTYGRLVYFSAIAALYVLPYIGVRLHTDIGTNQPFSYKTALNYRPDRLPPLSLCQRVVTNLSILYKIAFLYCTSGNFSASHGYVNFYNSYRPSTDIMINQPFSYKTALYYRQDRLPPLPLSPRLVTNQSILYRTTVIYCTSRYFSASHGYVNLYNTYPAPPLNWYLFIKTNLSVAFFYCTSRYFLAPHSYIYLYNSYPVPPLNWTLLKKTNPMVPYNILITEEDLLSGTDHTQLAGGPEVDISPESEAELLASDKDDMEVEDNDDDDESHSAAASESFCSANSSAGDPSSPDLSSSLSPAPTTPSGWLGWP